MSSSTMHGPLLENNYNTVNLFPWLLGQLGLQHRATEALHGNCQASLIFMGPWFKQMAGQKRSERRSLFLYRIRRSIKSHSNRFLRLRQISRPIFSTLFPRKWHFSRVTEALTLRKQRSEKRRKTHTSSHAKQPCICGTDVAEIADIKQRTPFLKLS